MTDLHIHGARPTAPTDDALLDELTHQARDLVRADVECGVVLREFRGLRLAGSSDVRVRRCGAMEQADRRGPGLTALEEDRVVVIADIRRTRRWPSWRDAALGQGFRTAVTLPAAVAPGIDAAVELLGATTESWQRTELRAAAAFARQVARVVALELEAARLQCLSEELFAALSARDAIGQAAGIVMAQRSCGPEEALGVLRSAAEHRGVVLRDLAAMVVSEMARSDAIRSSMFDETPAPREAVGTQARRLS
jgi:ANTAR domain/GAF domain